MIFPIACSSVALMQWAVCNGIDHESYTTAWNDKHSECYTTACNGIQSEYYTTAYSGIQSEYYTTACSGIQSEYYIVVQYSLCVPLHGVV